MTSQETRRRSVRRRSTSQGALSSEGAHAGPAEKVTQTWDWSAYDEKPPRPQLGDYELRETGDARLGIVEDERT
jgi:hypothetical protein